MSVLKLGTFPGRPLQNNDVNSSKFACSENVSPTENYSSFHLELIVVYIVMLKLGCGAVKDDKHNQPFA